MSKSNILDVVIPLDIIKQKMFCYLDCAAFVTVAFPGYLRIFLYQWSGDNYSITYNLR